jgi:hypothetical protein
MVEKVQESFEIGVKRPVGNAVGVEGAGQAGNPRGRFAGFGNRRMDQEHAGIGLEWGTEAYFFLPDSFGTHPHRHSLPL